MIKLCLRQRPLFKQMVFLIIWFSYNWFYSLISDWIYFLFDSWYFRSFVQVRSWTFLPMRNYVLIWHLTKWDWFSCCWIVNDDIFSEICWSKQEPSHFPVYHTTVIIYWTKFLRAANLWFDRSYFLFTRLILNDHDWLYCFCYIFSSSWWQFLLIRMSDCSWILWRVSIAAIQ